MLQLSLDTGCQIAAQEPADAGHVDACHLVGLGRHGKVELFTATTLKYDLETAGLDRVSARQQWLADRPFIQWIPGPATWDVSKWDTGDVWVGEVDVEALDRLREIIGTPVLGEPDHGWRRKQLDLHHASAAHLARVDGLVTTDKRHLLNRREAIRDAVGLNVLDLKEALQLVIGK